MKHKKLTTHRRLTRLEGQTSLLAKMTKTAFQHIDYRLLHLDTKLNSTVKHMTEFFKRTETHFRFTWEALVSNRLAIQLLSMALPCTTWFYNNIYTTTRIMM